MLPSASYSTLDATAGKSVLGWSDTNVSTQMLESTVVPPDTSTLTMPGSTSVIVPLI